MSILVVGTHTYEPDEFADSQIRTKLKDSNGVDLVFAPTLKRLEGILPEVTGLDALIMRPALYKELGSKLADHFAPWCDVHELPPAVLNFLFTENTQGRLPQVYAKLAATIKKIPIFVNGVLGFDTQQYLRQGGPNIHFFQPRWNTDTGNDTMVHWVKNRYTLPDTQESPNNPSSSEITQFEYNYRGV